MKTEIETKALNLKTQLLRLDRPQNPSQKAELFETAFKTVRGI